MSSINVCLLKSGMRRVHFLQRQIKQILIVRYVNYEFYNFDFIYKKAKTQNS